MSLSSKARVRNSRRITGDEAFLPPSVLQDRKKNPDHWSSRSRCWKPPSESAPEVQPLPLLASAVNDLWAERSSPEGHFWLRAAPAKCIGLVGKDVVGKDHETSRCDSENTIVETSHDDGVKGPELLTPEEAASKSEIWHEVNKDILEYLYENENEKKRASSRWSARRDDPEHPHQTSSIVGPTGLGQVGGGGGACGSGGTGASVNGIDRTRGGEDGAPHGGGGGASGSRASCGSFSGRHPTKSSASVGHDGAERRSSSKRVSESLDPSLTNFWQAGGGVASEVAGKGSDDTVIETDARSSTVAPVARPNRSGGFGAVARTEFPRRHGQSEKTKGSKRGRTPLDGFEFMQEESRAGTDIAPLAHKADKAAEQFAALEAAKAAAAADLAAMEEREVKKASKRARSVVEDFGSLFN
eukprot:TRINITY_DN42242_c0_g1_i1.p1 TRINITY_DN42242_c0_g1~~TRINITY_DN42242_c0_g1_i1.p1  ORF type:complete len:414 (+),score=74.31 TRINITY_DN42242_c0_g1_i1:39-1280(+)